MISILYNPTTQVAKLAFTLPITAGADVPVRVEFSPAPNAVSDIQLGLVSDATTPATLAFTDTIAPENASVWEGVLDANDSRLIAALAGKSSLQVVLALVCIIDGHRLVNSALRITVTPSVLSGPTATEGGPTYYTQAQVNALLVGLGGGGGIDTSLSAFTGTGGLENVATTALPVNTTYRRFYVAASGLVDFRLVAGTDTPVVGEKIRGTDYNASTNAKFWLRV